MLGCDMGTLFKLAVAGGSYQEGLTIHLQGVPPGILLTEEEIYRDLLIRKPGQGELTSPRREPDIPIIYSGVNAADTMPGFKNAGHTNGTPLVILIPNLDRHFEHIEQYQIDQPHPAAGPRLLRLVPEVRPVGRRHRRGHLQRALHLDHRRGRRGGQARPRATTASR